ncbi:hypothetical protein JR316_0005449 [Psilocybe cubensis]|uniref:Uncharacterized protein n=1 Tax=Psilocybe cubensis TaxID=181762 RepID=A0ACB8H6C2_PSICU|nr:hypothetical protein JR316_0005449 [Psilocybe cubensis]KAH9483343.1 hypothetical protein JR316_0005449 [Psilocybe cubensis]
MEVLLLHPTKILEQSRYQRGVALSVESILDVPRTPNGVFVFNFGWLITLALSAGVTADLLIAASMVYYLRKLASPTNLQSTTVFLNRLIQFSLLYSISLLVSLNARSHNVEQNADVGASDLHFNSHPEITGPSELKYDPTSRSYFDATDLMIRSPTVLGLVLDCHFYVTPNDVDSVDNI